MYIHVIFFLIHWLQSQVGSDPSPKTAGNICICLANIAYKETISIWTTSKFSSHGVDGGSGEESQDSDIVNGSLSGQKYSLIKEINR